MRSIDLNLDAGESLDALKDGRELALYDLVSSLNVACGGHAGNESSMKQVVEWAGERGLAVGAHPSFPDRKSFGRRKISMPHAELVDSLTRQIEALASVLRAQGKKLSHVKPHGALYNLAASEREFASAVIEAVRRIDPLLPIVGLAGSKFIEWCAKAGQTPVGEGFADRRYEDDGTLRGREHADALITDMDEAAAQACRLFEEGKTRTICVHSDSPKALELAGVVRQTLLAAKIEIRAIDFRKGGVR